MKILFCKVLRTDGTLVSYFALKPSFTELQRDCSFLSFCFLGGGGGYKVFFKKCCGVTTDMFHFAKTYNIFFLSIILYLFQCKKNLYMCVNKTTGLKFL